LDLRAPAFSSEQQPQDLSAALVAVASLVGGLAAWGLLAVLERSTTNPRRAWVAVASIALLASLGAPLSGTGVTAGDRIAMIGMHLAVAAVVIPFFYRSIAD
jgi:NO-binding membrane sensor protein with MHYT domain